MCDFPDCRSQRRANTKPSRTNAFDHGGKNNYKHVYDDVLVRMCHMCGRLKENAFTENSMRRIRISLSYNTHTPRVGNLGL